MLPQSLDPWREPLATFYAFLRNVGMIRAHAMACLTVAALCSNSCLDFDRLPRRSLFVNSTVVVANSDDDGPVV